MRKILIYILLVVLTACETQSGIEIDGGGSSYILSSFIYPDSDVVVHLYKSVPYNDTVRMSYITENQTIKISVNKSKTYERVLNGGESSVSFGRIELSPYDNIEISTQTPDNEQIKAETSILPPPRIDQVDTLMQSRRSRTKTLQLKITFSDGADPNGYYQIVVKRRDVLPDGQNIISEVSCNYADAVFNSDKTNLWGASSIGLFSGKTFDKPIRIFVYGNNVFSPRSEGCEAYLDVYLFSHTYNYYLFAKAINNSTNNEMSIPNFVAPAIQSNVDGGYGIVSGMSYSRYSMPLDDYLIVTD